MSEATDQLLIALANRMSGPQQQFDPAAFAALLKKEPPRRLDMSGNEITGDQNPFSNGFFKGLADRQAIETARLGMPGFSSLSPGQQVGALLTNMPGNRTTGAVAASPSAPNLFGGLFTVPPPLTGYDTPQNDALALAQNKHMFAPGGAAGFWSRVGRRR